MGPTSFTGIVYETSIEMGYFFIGAHPSCELRHPPAWDHSRTQQTTSDPSEPVDTSDPSGTTDPADPSNTGTACESNDDCAPGICGEDGTCQPRDLACFSDADCFDDEYCAFPSGSSYDPALAGACTPVYWAEECPLGQECIDGRCFSNYDCDPLPTAATAPQMKCVTAKPGPATHFQAYATSVSSAHVIGSAIAATCLNLDNLGGCSVDSDCANQAGCENGCSCVSGACQPDGACTTASDCPAGSYCAQGLCQPAPPCSTDSDCSPYGLVCENGDCTNPPPCGPNNTCPEGQVCATNYDPPACLPEGAGQCSRDEQCPADQYCDLFSATCAPGCRQGNCPAGQFCNQQHVCVDGNGSAIGDACSDNNQCPGGTTCAYNDPSAGLTCDLLPIGDCSKSCKQVCDLATSIIIDTCTHKGRLAVVTVQRRLSSTNSSARFSAQRPRVCAIQAAILDRIGFQTGLFFDDWP